MGFSGTHRGFSTVELIFEDQNKKELKRKMGLPVVLCDLVLPVSAVQNLSDNQRFLRAAVRCDMMLWLCYWYYVDTVVTMVTLHSHSGLELSRASTPVITLSFIKNKQ